MQIKSATQVMCVAQVISSDGDCCMAVQAFSAMDANGDGVLSFYEYTTVQLQLTIR